MVDNPEKDKMKLKEEGMNEHEQKETPAEEACKTCGKIGKECKCAQKGEPAGQNPEQDTASATDANSTVTTAAVVGTGQNVFTPSSNVKVGREASPASAAGQSPSEVSYGKSVDLTKSPLFVKMNEMNTALMDQFSLLEKNLHARMEALSKSVADRQANMEKTMKGMEDFYKKSFHKAIAEQAPVEKPVMKKQFSM